MSHFTVCVITKDGDYEKALAPFNQNIEVAPYIKETREECIDKAKQYAKNWFDSELDKKNKYLEPFSKCITDDEFLTAYKEFTKMDFDNDGNRLSTYNPNSKWDWYSLGGRWANSLKLKNGSKSIKDSEPSVFYTLELIGNSDFYKEGYTDHAQVKDIDFSPEKSEVRKHKRFWEVVVEDSPLEEGENKEDFDSFWNKQYYVEKYGNKECYVEEMINFSTYAMIYNGEWIAPGEIGWFGCSDDTYDSNRVYRKKFKEILNNLDPEDYISVIDCHI